MSGRGHGIKLGGQGRPPEKLPFGQRHEVGEGISYEDICWGKVPGCGAKALRQDYVFHVEEHQGGQCG